MELVGSRDAEYILTARLETTPQLVYEMKKKGNMCKDTPPIGFCGS
jgi:hypothetical protein